MSNCLTRNVSRQNPCPICGKPDMCFLNDRMEDGIVRICGRVSQDMVSGFDGKTYKKIGESSNSGVNTYTRYVDAEEDLLRQEKKRREWCIQNGYRYIPKDGVYLPEVEAERSQVVPLKRDDTFVDALPNELLDKILRKWLKSFILVDFHKKKLLLEWEKRKGLFEEITSTWLIRSLPPDDRDNALGFYARLYPGKRRRALIQDLISICKEHGLPDPAGIPGLYVNPKTGEWDINSGSGIIYPCYDIDGNIYRFRIGLDFPSVKGTYRNMEGTYHLYGDAWYFKPKSLREEIEVWRYLKECKITLNKKGLPDGKPENKYINFSSSKEIADVEKGIITNKFPYGAKSGAPISIYRPKVLKSDVVWFTEGEKKAMIIAATYGCVVVCIPGVNNISKVFENGEDSIVSRLYREGFKNAVVAFDEDKQSNEMVSKAELLLVKNLREHGFITFITKWSISFGKGIDDAIINGIMPQIMRVK